MPNAHDAAPTHDVVIVDDDPVLTALLRHVLGGRGYSIETMADGETAVRRLTGVEADLHPRAIVLDVSLPGIDGLAVLRALSAVGVTARSRVLMLTGSVIETEVADARALGAVDYLAKPLDIPAFVQRVAAALATR